MSRSLLTAIAAIACLHSSAQFAPDSSSLRARLLGKHDHVVDVKASLDYNANSLRNELPIALWKGSYLDRDLRERSRTSMRERNSVGYAIEARASYTRNWEKSDWLPVISVAHHEQMGTRFTRDLYTLTFFGNADYEERRADLGPSATTMVRYQTAGFGQQHARTRSYWRLDMVMGQDYEAVDARWASLYTGEDGRVLRANVLSDYYRSDTTRSLFATGLGAAVSGCWDMRLIRGSDDLRLSLEVRDLGIVGWSGHSILKDTIIEYTGIGVASILELDEVIIGEDQLLDTFGLRYDYNAFTRPLPFFLEARVRAPLSDRWNGSIALDQRYLPGYLPQLSFSGERRFGRALDGSATLSFGGFGGLRLGACMRYLLRERVLLELSSPHLPGFVSGSARGAGLLFAATVGF